MTVPSAELVAAMGPISRAMKSGRTEEAYALLLEQLGDPDVTAFVLHELLQTVVPSPYPR